MPKDTITAKTCNVVPQKRNPAHNHKLPQEG